MASDTTKRFLKKNTGLIPNGEQALAAVLAEAKGGSWRRGMRAAGTVGAEIAARGERKRSAEPEMGDAATLPDSRAFWVVITNDQLHLFEGMMNSAKAGPAGAHFPFERIADVNFNKKLLISKLTISFRDGSAVELDVAKQKTQPFIDAIEARFGAG